MRVLPGSGSIAWGTGLVAAVAPRAAHAAASSPELPFARLALGLILCSIVALLAALALRRFMRGGGFSIPGAGVFRDLGRQVSVLETHRLSPHADVCRLASGDTEYLLVVSSGAATVLESKARAKAASEAP